MRTHRTHDHCRKESPAAVDPALGEEALDAVRDCLPALRGKRPGLPFTALLRLGNATGRATLLLDLEAERRVGVPLLVVRFAQSPPRIRCVLTARERQVAERVAAGHANARIARELGISLATAKDHVHNALSKSGLPSRAALAAAFVRGEL